jgi:ectoine hydroxylase-related dioxygenase (phytanoyl-CoA dioxygenase family)
MSFQPKIGKLIMFPGYLPHGVERNGTTDDRISISFNVKLMRKIDGLYWSKNSK